MTRIMATSTPMQLNLKTLSDDEFLLKGNSACAGCGATLAIRWILKILGKDAILVMPAGCVSVFQGMFPYSSFNLNVVDSAFGAQASFSAGLAAAQRASGSNSRVVVIAGDGGTADIGFHAMSASAERGDDVLYICYDNEAYMNTGVQRSGLTPFGARTNTTPRGKPEWKKNMPKIMIAHGIPYVATASIGYPMDLVKKVAKAKNMTGFRYIHVLTPCPPGWKFQESEAVELGRLAVRSGAWPLFEFENGKLAFHNVGRMIPVKDYLQAQGRFDGLTEEELKSYQIRVDEELAYLEQVKSKNFAQVR